MLTISGSISSNVEMLCFSKSELNILRFWIVGWTKQAYWKHNRFFFFKENWKYSLIICVLSEIKLCWILNSSIKGPHSPPNHT